MMRKGTITFRAAALYTAVCFIGGILLSGLLRLGRQDSTPLIPLSLEYTPAFLKGIKIYPDNPFRFDFIVDSGQDNLNGAKLKEESDKLIRYFLASLTIPEDDLWVNLSPYEEDRITTRELGETTLGKDLLSQDYILKQLSSSLTHPESPLGKTFWKEVYQRAYKLLGTTNIPINTFNKIWIVQEKAVVLEKGEYAFVQESRLKVMLEEDYVVPFLRLRNLLL